MQKNFPRSIGDLIDEAVNPRLIIPANDIKNTANPTHTQLKAIAREIGFIVPAAVRDEINELDLRYMAVVKQFEQNTDRAALEDFRNHSEERDEKIVATENISHHTGLTLEDFKRVAREKLAAAKRLMQRHGKQTADICKPFLQKFADAIRDEADKRSLFEISRCDNYGFEWKPSDTVLRLYRAAQVIEDRLNAGSDNTGNRPKTIADFICYGDE